MNPAETPVDRSDRSTPGLRELLSLTPGRDQDGLLVRLAPTVSDAELVDLLVRPIEPAGQFVELRVESLLIARGPDDVDVIESSMLARPLERSTRRLAGILDEIALRHPDQNDRVADVLRRTVLEALDRDADTWAVGELAGWWLDSIERGADPAASVPVAERILGLAAVEVKPYVLAVERARRLRELGGP
ncbi:MAG TPA: hypothetical protein VIT65_26295 [Microlunatus sp.]